MQGVNQYMLNAILDSLETLTSRVDRLIDQRALEGRWLTVAEAAKRLAMSPYVLRGKIKEAVAEGASMLFGAVRFEQMGGGETRPRYRIWEPDVIKRGDAVLQAER